jgi:alanyl-tRNA synthetase
MQSNEIRSRFLKFFESRGHNIIPSASLVPENDPSVLFNTAGMQPLVPYLLGQKHPMGNRIADIQKCVRTGDLDDIGDNRHFSFFEMMGNWSLGDYFKEDAIKWSYEFLTSKEEGLGLDPNRLYVTIFAGDENAELDTESKDIWMSLGIPEHRIYALPADDNWWSPGDNGPCGPCSEMFYDMVGGIGDLNKDDFIKAVQEERIIEIWNDVFMEYEKKDGKVVGKLSQKNVDTGAGLERMTAVMQGKNTAYDTDLLSGVMEFIKNNTTNYNERSARIITDHIRTSVFMIADGVLPANKDRGYILRRLLRRAILNIQKLGMNAGHIESCINLIKDKYKISYPNIDNSNINQVIKGEDDKFTKTLESGLKEFEKGTDPFILATTYGFPIEVTEELAKEKGIVIDKEDFNKKMSEHQKLSQTSSAGMFKGGLANHNDKTIRLHTAHHLLLASLQEVLGKSVKQRGSNITEERLRIDFIFDRKMTDEEKKEVEDKVNDKISQSLNVIRREMPLQEAESIGAEMEFGAKYPETVSVYFIEDANGNAVSKEFCGGPHVNNTKELGHFKIQKEEAVSAGVRRIKAILE